MKPDRKDALSLKGLATAAIPLETLLIAMIALTGVLLLTDTAAIFGGEA